MKIQSIVRLIAIEDTIYRKTSTCNDIDVADYNYICFHERNFSIVDCTKGSGTPVICYLFSPTLTGPGIGVAFSISQFICKFGDICARCLNKLSAQGKWCIGVTQFILVVVILSLMILPLTWLMLSEVDIIMFNDYFTYGDVPMRFIMLILIALTISIGGILIFPNCICCCCCVRRSESGSEDQEEHYYCDAAYKHSPKPDKTFRCSCECMSKLKYKSKSSDVPLVTNAKGGEITAAPQSK